MEKEQTYKLTAGPVLGYAGSSVVFTKESGPSKTRSRTLPSVNIAKAPRESNNTDNR